MQEEAQPQSNDILWKIRNNPNSNPLYKSALLILDSINETIDAKPELRALKQQNYDSILFSSVFSTVQQYVGRSYYDNMDALLLLLSYTTSKVSPGLLQQLGDQIFTVLKSITTKNDKKCVQSGKFIASIYQLLLSLKSAQEWNQPSATEMLEFILDTLIDERPKLRKQASKSLSMLIERGLFTKVKGTVGKIEQFVLTVINDALANPKQCVLMLYFLNSSLRNFPIETTINIIHHLTTTLKNEECSNDLATHIYSTIENLLAVRTLNPDTVEEYLKDFLNNVPTIDSESHINIAYSQCLVQCLLHLHTIDPNLAKTYVSSCISLCGELLLAESSKISSHAAKSIELLISYTIEPTLWQNTSALSRGIFHDINMDVESLDISENKGPTSFQRVVAVMSHFLSSRYDQVQRLTSSVLGAFFERLEIGCQDYTKDLICEFVSKRTERAYDLWESTIGKYVAKVGPQLLLEYYPLRVLEFDLNDEDYEEKSSSWLLPLLKKYMKVSSIKLFFDYLLPIAKNIKLAFEQRIVVQGTEKARLYEILYNQIWELFPRFCRFTKENINITTELFAVSTEMLNHASRDAQKFVFKGMENTVGYIMKLPKHNSVEMTRAQNKIQELADKFNPMLCNTYIKEQNPPKNLLNLIRAIAFLCSQAYLERVYLKNIQRIIEAKAADKLKGTMIIRTKEADLLVHLAEALELKDAKYDVTIKFIRTFLGDSSILQKKAYLLLRIVMGKVHRSFLQNIFAIMQEFKVTNQSAKFPRLICIEGLFEKIPLSSSSSQEVLTMLQEFLPEILLALKETNKKCRKAANDLLDNLTKKFAEQGMAEDFVGMIIGAYGAKTSLMKSAAVTGAARALKVAGSNVKEEFILETMSLSMMLIREKNREIYKSVLFFLKIFLKLVPKEKLKENLPNIFTALFEWDEDARDCHISLIKFLIEKLLRKIDQPTLESYIPGDHKKLVKYIKKMDRQEKKKKREKYDERNGKVFLEDLFNKELQKMNKKKRGNNNNDNMDEDDDGETAPKQRQRQQKHSAEPVNENENNLLLKFDAEKERFHFEEHPIVKVRAQRARAAVDDLEKDVFFDDKSGKLVVQEQSTISGFKRRREEQFDDLNGFLGEGAGMEEEKGKSTGNALKDKLRKKVKVGQDSALTGNLPKEENEPSHRLNNKVISDIKMLKSGQDSSAFIQLTPKVLNKRNKVNASKAFDFLVSKKKTGAFKGLKSKVKA